MKPIIISLFFFFIVSQTNAHPVTYTASTPGGIVVKLFLGIPVADSIDFIRWKIEISDNDFRLWCNYGISLANTNGFTGGGKKIECTGALTKENHYYQLRYNNRSLKMIALNTNLLHILDTNNQLLAGNGGWSYTLNNIAPATSSDVYFKVKPTVLKDSIAFEGRTPCQVPGIVAAGTPCYKLKWHIVLFADAKHNTPGTYKILGSAYRDTGGKKGNWQIVTGKGGQVFYQLNDEQGKGFLYLLEADKNILVFTNAQQQLLTGNEDFSYTLNRRQ